MAGPSLTSASDGPYFLSMTFPTLQIQVALSRLSEFSREQDFGRVLTHASHPPFPKSQSLNIVPNYFCAAWPVRELQLVFLRSL